MKIQIDTVQKTITMGESINFGELVKQVRYLLNGEWENYTLLIAPITHWINPVIIKEPIPYPPNEPFYRWPIITCMDIQGVYSFKIGD